MGKPKRRTPYLWGLAVSVLATLLFVLGFNLLIDPYGTFRFFEISWLNRIKIHPHHDLATIKAYAMPHVAPDALILGNSRAEVGFDPLHPVWREAGYASVYNAAVPGSPPRMAWWLLERAARVQRPHYILLGLDFFDFPIAADANPSASVTAPKPVEDRFWYLRATLTLQAVLDSIQTIRRQYQQNPEQLTLRGHNPLLEYIDIAKSDGYWALFRQRAEENVRIHSAKPANLYWRGTRRSPEFDDVRRIVRWAVQHEAFLDLAIYPYHAQLLIMIDELERWALFEEWKRHLVRIRDEEATTPEARQRIALVDYSGFSPYAQEPIPARHDRKTATRWYWEAGHFKRELGDLLLQERFGQQSPAERIGVRLDANNIETHLARQRADKIAYRNDHIERVQEMADLIPRRSGR